MPIIPLSTMKSLAKTLINAEGKSIIYRQVTTTNVVASGSTTVSNSDTSLTAYVGSRKAQFKNGTLVQVPGERVLIPALDLAVVPAIGDVVILAATDSPSARRRVVLVDLVSTQGSDIMYAVEVE